MLCLGSLLAALAVVGGPASGVASADCTDGTSTGCLPAGEYSLDTVWNCSSIYSSTFCYANGVKSYTRAVRHTFGWASASNSSFGTPVVCVYLDVYAGACARDLARVCFHANCYDQLSYPIYAYVRHQEAGAFVISGHAKA